MNYNTTDKLTKKFLYPVELQYFHSCSTASMLPLMTEHPSSKPRCTTDPVNGLLVIIISCWHYKEAAWLQSDRAERVINNASASRPPNTGSVMFLLHGDQ